MVQEINNVFHDRSFLSCQDFSADELRYLISFALYLKTLRAKGHLMQCLKGKNIGLLFAKNSTRTRSAFVIAAHALGAQTEFMNVHDLDLGKRENIADTAQVLGEMYDALEFRGYQQSNLVAFAKYAGVPVWNGLTDTWHPTQMISDFMTIKEKFGHLCGLKLAYLGDGRNNTANSLLITGTRLGVEVHIVAPKFLQPKAKIVALAKQYAKQSKTNPLITSDITQGIQGVNIIYTDSWVSMGEHNWVQRIKLLKPYQVNKNLLQRTKTRTAQLMFMHCLPAFHDSKTEIGQEIFKKYGLKALEVTDEVFHSRIAWQFRQAANKIPALMAIMATSLGDLYIPKV